MSIEADMRTYILTLTSITDIIGTSTAARIYYQKLPDDPTLPAIVYNRISDPPGVRSHSGDSSLSKPRIQYSIWATTDVGVMALADAFENEFLSFSGTAGSSTVYATIVENRLSMIDPESKFYHIPIDLMIQYNG
jgi:hypothetical protein